VIVAGAFTIGGLHHHDHQPPNQPTTNQLGGDPNNAAAGPLPSVIAAPPDPATASPAASVATTPASEAQTGVTGRHPSGRSTTAAPPPAVTYSATAGPGCGSAYQRGGYYSDSWAGWLRTGSTCGIDKYDSLPESGDPVQANPAVYSLWTFSTGAVRSGSCAVSVYIPNNSDIRYVGGAPAHYIVSGASNATLTIDQPANLGSWVAAGRYQVDSGTLSIKLTNIGVDWTDTTVTYRHVAAGDIRIDCTTS
jgi:translation initiation factor IF-2